MLAMAVRVEIMCLIVEKSDLWCNDLEPLDFHDDFWSTKNFITMAWKVRWLCSVMFLTHLCLPMLAKAVRVEINGSIVKKSKIWFHDLGAMVLARQFLVDVSFHTYGLESPFAMFRNVSNLICAY